MSRDFQAERKRGEAVDEEDGGPLPALASPRRRQAVGQLVVAPRRASIAQKTNSRADETTVLLEHDNEINKGQEEKLKDYEAKERRPGKVEAADLEKVIDDDDEEDFEIEETWECGDLSEVLFAWRAIAAEYLATLLLTFVAIGVGISTVGRTGEFDGGALAAIGLVSGFNVATMVYATANLSGAHMNPAVTLSVLAAKRMPVLQAFGYIIAQLLGAVTGAGLDKILFPDIIGERVKWGTPVLAAEVTSTMTLVNGTVVVYQYGISAAQGVGIEALLTFIMVFAVFSTAGIAQDSKHMGRFAPLTSGLAVLICVALGAPFTGAALSPARAFGPALISNHWENHWVWWVGPITGAVIAGLTYKYVFVTPEELRQQVRLAERLFLEQERMARLGR